MSASRSTATDRLLVAAFGFVAGYAVGVLLAPREGEQTRRRIAERTREASLTARRQAREAAEPLAERARATAQDFAGRHVPLAEDWDVVDGKDLLDDLRRMPPR